MAKVTISVKYTKTIDLDDFEELDPEDDDAIIKQMAYDMTDYYDYFNWEDGTWTRDDWDIDWVERVDHEQAQRRQDEGPDDQPEEKEERRQTEAAQ